MTLPMALRYGLSAYMNEVILFAKGTAALGAITVMDLLAVANSAVSTTYDPMTPLVMAAAIYWCIVQVIQRALPVSRAISIDTCSRLRAEGPSGERAGASPSPTSHPELATAPPIR